MDGMTNVLDGIAFIDPHVPILRAAMIGSDGVVKALVRVREGDEETMRKLRAVVCDDTVQVGCLYHPDTGFARPPEPPAEEK